MQKGFGSSNKKKILKDSRYLRFYNDEKYAEDLLKNKNNLLPPLYGALLKNEADVEIFQKIAFMTRREN